MVKENHTQKTIIMPIALEDRLIAYLQKLNDQERRAKVPKSQQTTQSALICLALDGYLAVDEPT